MIAETTPCYSAPIAISTRPQQPAKSQKSTRQVKVVHMRQEKRKTKYDIRFPHFSFFTTEIYGKN